MSEAPQRRRLLAGLTDAPKAVPAALPEERIAEAAVRHGFSAPPSIEAPPAEALPATITLRRNRHSAGRTEQFNVRLRPDTLEMIYGEANDRNIPLAQVLEEAMAALKAGRG
ncbi:stability/partitioning determinant [Sphingomonas crocodyli]|uniref:Stability/partitioning determinant n=1 Tax=Sphingomonas crocodyli TaxID=1979270 RepID=A0A437LY45_9SPHN|nr:stability/partitioning determinant [Sphingomonas crocodyli]RVT90320.1 stability/partitioning determinant [Sphingomonas crocodyli]